MPGTTVLHIQTDDSPVTRVMELSGATVRIGRGPQCEACLGDPALAEVQCMLRRRGETWHIQPVGPPGRISIDGQPVDVQRPLPLGVHVRVGQHWLSLRVAEEALAELGSFDAPIVVEAVAEPVALEAGHPDHQGGKFCPRSELPRDELGLEAEHDRLMSWQSRLEQHERWLRARQEERHWEATWEAPGGGLRTRAAPTVARPTLPPEPPEPPLAHQRLPRVADVENRRATWQPPPAARNPFAQQAAPVVAPVVPDPVVLPPLEPPFARAPAPVVPGASPPVTYAPTSHPAHTSRREAQPVLPLHRELRAEFDPLLTRSPVPRIEPDSPVRRSESSQAVDTKPTTPAKPAHGRRATERSRGRDEFGAPCIGTRNAAGSGVTDARTTSRTPSPSALLPTPAPGEARHAGRSTSLAPLSLAQPLEGPEWPTAAAIFAARPPRLAPAPAAKAKNRSWVARPAPTHGSEPEHWTLPMRYAWATSVAIVLSVGLGGLPLCWWWACDDYSAGLVANRLLRSGNSTRSGAQRQETLDPENEPGASWWRSTAAHMSLWAMSLDRASSDPDRAEQVRFFLQAARTSSPVQATARYALAQLQHGASQETALFESLGLSRDVVSLTWKGRCLLGAGKTEAALRAYGEALEMAARADLAELERPTFSRDQQLTRYLLPYESLMGPVIRELADAHEWTFTDWSTALPACAVAPLAASGVLKQLGRSAEAEKALDLALVQAQQPPLPGCSTAVHLAAEAEALALRNHWQEAAERYRQAIDLMTHDAIRRSWWVNLADIYGHLHDDPKKRAAWEAAKATDPNDEITRRVVRSQTEAGIGVSNDGTARRSLVGGQPPTSGRDPTPSERTARGPEP